MLKIVNCILLYNKHLTFRKAIVYSLFKRTGKPLQFTIFLFTIHISSDRSIKEKHVDKINAFCNKNNGFSGKIEQLKFALIIIHRI